ncbi:hypothetical protein HYH03_012679 [Edaphochlamys debaryana]|uniref:GmrSD restriction endonucleases N-terminal domain-containing protein n=1 Tax=Edaphochlamys debaryana TaxID=47281 RepID=A0A835XXW6_9CHLO|nr:hypothetical protein HYH03_012679 [Edaphochlamys debaryana]|eukprot:KAG2488885.1 hypothetical protein HYH03_012679 [Edaphochlamys debaryana]
MRQALAGGAGAPAAGACPCGVAGRPRPRPAVPPPQLSPQAGSRRHTSLLPSAPAARRPPPGSRPPPPPPPAAPAASMASAADDDDVEPPVRRRRVEIQSSNMSLGALLNEVEAGEVNLEPEYQRDFVWDEKKCIGLVKTVFEGLPISAVMLHSHVVPGRGYVKDVVDGKQRLATLYKLHEGWGDNTRFPKAPTRLKLDKREDELAPLLDGRAFADLALEDQSAMRQYQVQVQVIPESTELETVFRIYENMNAGGAQHSAQQLRRAAFYGPYIQLINRLAAPDSPSGRQLRELAGLTEQEQSEQLGEELVLRFFALRNAVSNPETRRFRAPIKAFLNRELTVEEGGRRVVRKPPAEEQERTERALTDTLQLVRSLGLKQVAEEAGAERRGGGSFRKGGGASVSPVWDVVLLGLSLALPTYPKLSRWERNADALRRGLAALLRDPRWAAAGSALSQRSLAERLALLEAGVVRPAMRDEAAAGGRGPRGFPPSVMEELIAAGGAAAGGGGRRRCGRSGGPDRAGPPVSSHLSGASSSAPGPAARFAASAFAGRATEHPPPSAAAALRPAAAAPAAAPASALAPLGAAPSPPHILASRAPGPPAPAPPSFAPPAPLCAWCGKPIVDPRRHAEVDHVLP